MCAQLEEKIFFQGANADEELRSVPQGDYLLDGTLNIRIFDNNGQNMGKVVNIKGTTLVSFNLPQGRNVVIGARSDTDTGKIFYAIFNDPSGFSLVPQHAILLYDPKTQSIQTVFQSELLGFTEFSRINHMNLVNEKLLYWTDGTIPKKINILKALENKARIYNVYFGTQSGVGRVYTFTVKDSTNTTVFQWISPFVPPTTGLDDAFYISSRLANFMGFPSNPYLSIRAEGAYVQATMKQIGKFTLEVTTANVNQVIAIAQNFYPEPFSFDIIDRLKYPPHFQPSAQYEIDNTRDTNYVQNRIFQFAVQYVYDDDEPSTLSPISVLPDFGNQCTQSLQQSLYNYIKVDFTEARLNDPVSRSIIQHVNVYFREGNTGKFQLIKNLQQWEFGIGSNTLNFYNDGIYQVLDDQTATTLFSAVPINNGAQEFIGNHIIDGDVLEGYDNVFIDAELKTTYNAPPKDGFTLKGTVNIAVRTIYGTDLLKEPIMNIDNQQSVFGGIKANIYNPVDPNNVGLSYISDLKGRYFQNIPLGGFVFYLAGTNYYGVSKQRTAALNIATQDSTSGVVNVGSPAALQEVVVYIKNIGFSSEWQIDGVPPGIYSLRVASHLTTDIDLADPSLGYQGTSTTILTKSFKGLAKFPNLHGGVANSGKTEAIVEILSDGTINIKYPDTFQTFFTTGSGGDIGETFIEDISISEVTGGQNRLFDSPCWAGYLVDSEGISAPASFDAILLKERVTRASITSIFTFTGIGNQGIYTTSDHNGFFFCHLDFFKDGDTLTQMIITDIVSVAAYAKNNPTGLTFFDYTTYPTTMTVRVFVTQIYAVYSAYYYKDTNLTAYGRTFIEGRAIDSNNNPVANINFVAAYHGSFLTKSDGTFRISFYSYGGGNTLLLLASSSGLCSYIITPNTFFISFIVIGQGYFNNSNPYDTQAPYLALLSNVVGIDAFKRGGDWDMGIVYYDRGLRSGTVNANEKTHLHVCFYTEKDPLTGLIPPTGEPSVGWLVRNPPPSWATHWQWVRTSNLALSYYLQFIANTIHYVNLPSPYDPGSNPDVTYSKANYISIDLTNITAYFNRNSSSLIAYTWQKGDRIRFIKDAQGNFFTSYLDFEIVNGDANYISVGKDFSIAQITSGVEFEIYTPRLVVANKIYYEIGEEFEVGYINGKPYHKGLTQDQDPNSPYNVPAMGTFRTGDAWYRKRGIPYQPAAATLIKPTFIDDQSVSDFYPSKADNIGRVNILNINNQQLRREKTLLPSGVYIQETRVNLLSWTVSTDAVDIEKGEGAISKLQVVGRILLAYQPSRVSSVYIKEIQYVDSSGKTTLTKSDSLIGTVNPLELLTGTINPESVYAIEGRAYHFDQMNGLIVRYGGDGLFPISSYKIASFAWNKAQEMSKVNNTGVYALGFLNPSQGEYGISFVDLKNRNNRPAIKEETISFVEKANRWQTPYSHLAEQYAYSNGSLIGFKGGQLWIHDSDDQHHNNFYGVQYNSQIAFVSNQNNDKTRIFLDLVVDGSDVWWCPDNDSIIIPTATGYPNGMASRLQKAAFRRVGTDWYAAFKKDLNTPNKPSALEALVNGRNLQGHIIVVRLYNDSTSYVDLKSSAVRYNFMEFTKK